MLTIEAAFDLAEQGHRVLAAEEHAVGVDGHHAAPFGEGGLLDIAGRGDTGVVDETVEAAVRALDLGDRGLPVRFAGHVERDVGRAAASEIAADGGAARLLDRLAHGAPERAGCAGDQHDVACEGSVHRLLLKRWAMARPMP